MGYRDDYKTAEMTSDGLANMLTMAPTDALRLAAEAELRLREHKAVLAQADFAERAARAAERQATAAERGTSATVVYVRLTFGLLVFTALAALAAWQHSCASGSAATPSGTARPAAPH